jgi:thiopeptide-type bacteriocin biosynthesis protein
MECLCNLADRLSSDPARRGTLRFRCNTSLHLAAGKYHHVRGDWQEGGRIFQLVATDPTPALDATLLRAVFGATAGELASSLVASDPEIAPEEADVFLGRLIESQLLVAELVPPVTGREAILHMAEQLEQAKASGIAAELRSVAEELRVLDENGLGAGLRAYDGIVNAVSRLGGGFQPGRLVQVDVIKPAAAASLDRRLVSEILAAIQTLHTIRDSGQPVLQQFKEEFQERYQDQEVPLLEALDDEAGIGFEQEDNPTAEPLIAGIDFRRAEEPSPAEDRSVPPVLARRLEELRSKKGTVLALDTELLDELKVAGPLPLPDAFSVMGAWFLGPEGQQGFYVQTIFGPSGANPLARFRDADERLAECVQAHVQAEEALHPAGVVLAEIAHLPDGRAGNVICRQVLRKYEIPLLATPGVPLERQIALSDLTVSLRDGRIVLRSRRLGAEVLPRLTSAHNFAHPRSLKLYKFLCLLQHQGTCTDLAWDWGAAGHAPFLPRVALGNIVVSLACWRIDQETALSLTQGRTPVAQWRQVSQVPRFAFVAEFDNQLLIDFENPLAVETFLEHIRKQPETILVEMLPAPGALSVHGPEGSFVHEIILPFVRKKPAAAATREASAPAKSNSRAVGVPPRAPLEPGAEWLFAKLYCSPSHADRLLLELVQPLVTEVRAAGTADRWFFLRYGDPRWHLRLRFHGDAAALSGHVLPLLGRMAGPFRRQGIVWRLEFDRYEPEVERYGGAQGIGIAERLFQSDSELCLDLLPLFTNDVGAELRWQLAFCGVDSMLTGLGFSNKEKQALARQMRAAREQTWVADEAYRQQLARKFRSGGLRQALAAILNDLETGDGGLFPRAAVPAFSRFSAALQITRRHWEELGRSGQLTSTIPELATSLVHMHLNRMLRSCHHEQEAVLFDLLVRSYAAKLAREETGP